MKIAYMKKIVVLFIAAVMLSPVVAMASGNVHLEKAAIDIYDKESLRRGAQAFGDYCYSCHSASFMRFNRIAKDLDMPEDEVRNMLIHTRSKKGAPTKIGDLMKVSMTADYAKNAFGTAVPDLSLVARARGAGCRHAECSVVTTGSASTDLEGFEQIQAGTMSPEEYDAFLTDLTNFMVYLAEPVQVERRSMGWKVLLFLVGKKSIGKTYTKNSVYWHRVCPEKNNNRLSQTG